MWNNPKEKKIRLKTALQCSPLLTQHAKRKMLLTAVVTKTLLPALFTVLSSIHHHPELIATFPPLKPLIISISLWITPVMKEMTLILFLIHKALFILFGPQEGVAPLLLYRTPLPISTAILLRHQEQTEKVHEPPPESHHQEIFPSPEAVPGSSPCLARCW